ncbi:MAG: type II toxin-antitoxin system YafQ family toxin [Bacteroidaceae bacterium]|nr:type II toxin-antitoxin system YafQ family toxin [Bacteroidaceae bacterium]
MQPDWLLIWEQDDFQLRLILVDTGTHADLF